MGKRSRQEAFAGTAAQEHGKDVKTTHSGAPRPNKARVKGDGPPVQGLTNGQKSRTIERSPDQEARDWLTTVLSQLRALEDSPALTTACTSIVGKETTDLAAELTRVLRSKRSAIRSADAGRHVPPQPQSSKKRSIDYTLLPPLPEIRDPELARRAFRHKSTLSDQEISSGATDLDYERLEFIGDSYLNIISTRFLADRFPRYSEGRLSELRSLLTCNETFSRLSLRYGFDERLQVTRKFARLSDANHDSWTKILGDLFEAYVAALIQSRPDDGFAVAEDWLYVLWNHLLPGEEPLVARKGAKTDLARRVVSKGIKLLYESTKPPIATSGGRELFTVGVFITGWGLNKKLLGEGVGMSMTEAGHHAADEALMNTLTIDISRAKCRFDSLWREEQDREGGPRQDTLDRLEAEYKWK